MRGPAPWLPGDDQVRLNALAALARSVLRPVDLHAVLAALLPHLQPLERAGTWRQIAAAQQLGERLVRRGGDPGVAAGRLLDACRRAVLDDARACECGRRPAVQR